MEDEEISQELNKLLEQIQSLHAEKEMLVKALEFYADEKNWEVSESVYEHYKKYHNTDRKDLIGYFFDRIKKDNSIGIEDFVGGFRAREALAKIQGDKK